ncbi:AraC family transcriptional regulator ligand-binding domain-containing protein [Bacillus sonorensis]|uniref:AraC family transcriptional regulator n=1 Tax=Bacillus sonorensis TaxID=119858 RepID=UPI0022825E05|nr:AraC family transcriptional regulator [Bacillus sonorensis]MCZ0067281.1 AraC family transcriptional regulator ligand-binding domain-containing protein [Bacillus sonorensis]MCZ0095811.1 AraC family transcriptional regulator ligand-binding domain-containing protein [Bacillus sonorensis]MEC1354738.1 AraC family transcriptional regulator ligand-binding domain-containing protein [Bacillus sonorensis]MEC1426939.1 AraC family transcriptional regulator ligand-binding domain-containing protein [Bacil
MTSHARIKIPAGFWTGLRQLGIAAHDVVRKARLPLTIITEPVVTTTQYFAIWQAYSELIDDTAKGIIELVTAFETAHYPPAVLATYHARDYRDALKRMARYKQLCPPESLRITEEGEHCTIELEWLNTEQAGPPMLVGITLAFLLELGRRGTGQPLTARLVEFSHSMGDVQALEAYFGCRIRIGANCNRLTLHRGDLDRPFVSYNAELLEILTPALDQSLDEQKHSLSITEMVKWIMKRSLTAGRPDIQTVASELGMSDRTLQRRLTDEGTSFKHLLTQVRHEQAREYLADPSLDIKEVAFLIGYEDQNSFYRAFRLWEGDTPSNWRTEHLGTNPIN